MTIIMCCVLCLSLFEKRISILCSLFRYNWCVHFYLNQCGNNTNVQGRKFTSWNFWYRENILAGVLFFNVDWKRITPKEMFFQYIDSTLYHDKVFYCCIYLSPYTKHFMLKILMSFFSKRKLKIVHVIPRYFVIFCFANQPNNENRNVMSIKNIIK